MITRLAVFDFDGTLFKSPERPPWWPWQGFWGRIETLSPPFVPEHPGADWWAENVVAQAKEAIADPETHSILLTGRPPKLAPRVQALLLSAGLTFDVCSCVGSGEGSTLEMKQRRIRSTLAALPGIQRVEMWEDRPEHVEPFQAFLREMRIGFQIHLVPRATREFDHRPEGAA